MTDRNENRVGYMSPPKHTRFEKGKSGNPKGRPKKPDDVYSVLHRVLKRKVRPKGADRQMPISEALVRKLREHALSGDRRALDLQRRILEEAGVTQSGIRSPEETKQRVLEGFRRMGVRVISDGGDNE